MKLLGYVEVFNHLHNISVSRSRHSTVSLFRDGHEAVMLIQQPSNKQGQRYKIAGNIIKVFTQFIAQGKITIRMKDPPHELRLQNEPLQLMSFLKFLKKCFGAGVLSLPDVPANLKFIKGPPTTVVINSLKDYGMLDKLSLNTEKLQISNIKISELPRSVARLKKLTRLELSYAHLFTMPTLIRSFPNLMELVLSYNFLESNEMWSIVNSRSLQTSLKLLDLQHNRIAVLPDEIHNLQGLVTLKLDHNDLNTIPHTVSNMKNLRFFSLSSNPIISYPYTVRFLRNVSFDVSDNKHIFPAPFIDDTDYGESIRTEKELHMAFNTRMHSLKELASRAIHNNRVGFKEFGLPQVLQSHLRCVKICHFCDKACFNEYFVFFECLSLKNCVESLVASFACLTVHFYICSHKCMLLMYPKLKDYSKDVIRYICYSQYCKSEK